MSSEKSHRLQQSMVSILVELSAPGLKSWPSIMLAVSRSLEKLADLFQIGQCVLAITKPQTVHILARHNVQQFEMDTLVEYLEDLHDRVEDLSWAATCIPEVYRLDDDSDSQSISSRSRVYRVNLDPDNCLCGMFDLDRQSQDIELAVASYLLHVAKTVQQHNFIKRQVEAKEALEQANAELKATQASLLNIMEDLRNQNQDLTNLNSLSSKFASCSSVHELARIATEATSELLGGPIVALLVSGSDGAKLDVAHVSGSEVELDGLPDIQPGDTVPPEPLFETIDLSADPPYRDFCKALGCKSGIAFWLVGKTKVLGLLVVCEHRWHRVFTEDEIENLSFLCNTLSISIDNLWLLECTTKQLHEMSTLKEYIETVVDSVEMAILVVDSNFRITMFSKGFERLYGYKSSDFIGKHLFEAFPHLLEQGFAEIIETVKSGKPFVRNGWRRKNLDGTEVVQNIRVFPHRDASGSIIGGIAIITDVTEKVKLEDQLDRSEAKFRKLVEELDDGYLIVAGQTVVYANRSAASMSGLPIHEIIGNNPNCLFPDASFLSQNFAARTRCESKLIHTSGTLVPVEVTVYPCDYGGKQAISVIIRDITDRKNIEMELAEKNREMRLRNEQITRLNQELEATVNRLKQSQESLLHSEKVAMLSEIAVAANHEINQPLFSILGQAQLLLKDHARLDDDALGRIKEIEEAALRIACVTKKITNLASSMAGQGEIQPARSPEMDMPPDLSEDLIVDSCQNDTENQ